MGTTPLQQSPPTLAQFSDAAGCRRWVAQLPLTNVQVAHGLISAQLNAIHGARLSALERLRILEQLRQPVAFLQTELVTRYAGKPIPFAAAEAVAWESVVSLWQQIQAQYELCLGAYRDGDIAIAPHAALLTMRRLRLVSSIMFDYYRAYRQIPATLWRELHELYSFAEMHGFSRIRIQDSFGQHDPDSSCAESYLLALLAHVANPYSLSARQLMFLERWLERWTALVGISQNPLPPSPVPALAVNLSSPEGATLADAIPAGPNVRYLDLEQFSKTLRQTINLLKQGQQPGQLGLGDDARQPGCENLVMLLYVHWCRAGSARMEERQSTDEPVKVCFGLEAMHRHIGGHDFRRSGELTSREKQDLATFGFIVRTHQPVAAGAESGIEEWRTVNHSASGFMCMLRDPQGPGRVRHNQLVAVKRQGTRNFHVGMIQWLRLEENRELRCGIRLFAGVPQAIAVRAANPSPVYTNRYESALLLPEVVAPAMPATLILPPGWFQNGRFIEMQTDRKQTVKLLNLFEKGSDFDRGSVTII